MTQLVEVDVVCHRELSSSPESHDRGTIPCRCSDEVSFSSFGVEIWMRATKTKPQDFKSSRLSFVQGTSIKSAGNLGAMFRSEALEGRRKDRVGFAFSEMLHV